MDFRKLDSFSSQNLAALYIPATVEEAVIKQTSSLVDGLSCHSANAIVSIAEEKCRPCRVIKGILRDETGEK